MNQDIASTEKPIHFWVRFYSLIIAVLTVGLATYFIVPMLPIYCVESLSRGGLGWTRTDACSLYGTYLLIAHISPFIGGILADVLFGQVISMMLGYLFAAYGLFLLWFFPATMLVPGFLLYGLGTGCIKVGLATAVGKMCFGQFSAFRNKAYEYHYFMSCIGFIAGNFFSNLFFDLWGMQTLFLIGAMMLSVSLIFYFCCCPFRLQSNTYQEARENTSKEISSPLTLFVTILCISALFFTCGNQLNASVALFLHQQVERSFFGWVVPALWFSVFGYIVMIALTPLRRKLWQPFERTISFIEPVKLAIGLVLLGAAFLLFSLCASFSEAFGKNMTMIFILLAMGLFFVSDAHVRPLLFSSATKFAPAEYQTIASAVAYSAVGFGGKLAGYIAGTSDIMGFSQLFLMCAGISFFSCVASLCLWKWQANRSLNKTVA